MLCNDMQWEGVKTSPGLEARLFAMRHYTKFGLFRTFVL